MNIILFKRSEVSKDGKSIQLLEKDPRTIHIFGHLRKVDGDSVTIGIISGRRGKAIVRTDGGDGKRLEFEQGVAAISLWNDDKSGDSNGGGSNQTQYEIVLVLSLPFPRRLKVLWAQIASMGVTRICIIRGALSDPNYCKTSAIAPEVYRPLVEEGMSQGCHTKEVTVEVDVGEPVSRAALEKLGLAKTTTTTESWSDDDVAIFLDCGDEAVEPPPCRQVIVDKLSGGGLDRDGTKKRVVLAIGSERGWTESEAKLFHEAGYESASLGRSILRVDTAVIAGLGIVSAALDELEHEQRQTKQANQNGNTANDFSARKRKQDLELLKEKRKETNMAPEAKQKNTKN
jgi:16S rRNA U1498 N3-methylase RsmE